MMSYLLHKNFQQATVRAPGSLFIEVVVLCFFCGLVDVEAVQWVLQSRVL